MKQPACKRCSGKQMPCGCCAGVAAVTPLATANRPGLDKLLYRAGTHATFLATMQARLTSDKLPQLAKLATRAASDPALALLDAWATVADVLTFYQERIANEGYLQTATERRSILELARLVGYRPRPGVAASAYFALTLDDKYEVMIEPFQVRAQSVPDPGESAQTFENVETLEARAAWNRLRPRLTRPQRASELAAKAATTNGARLYLKGVATGLNVNDPLLIVAAGVPKLYRVLEVKPDSPADRTQVRVELWQPERTGPAARERLDEIAAPRADAADTLNTALTTLRAEMGAGRSDTELADFIEGQMLPDLSRAARRRNISAKARAQLRALHDELAATTGSLRPAVAPAALVSAALTATTNGDEFDILGGVPKGGAKAGGVVNGLIIPPSVPPPDSPSLRRGAQQAVAPRSDLGLQVFGALFPQQRAALARALANASVPTLPDHFEVYALRVKAAPFGHNAPRHAVVIDLDGDQGNKQVEFREWTAEEVREAEEKYKVNTDEFSRVIYLDASYDKVLPDSWVIVDTSAVLASRSQKIAAANPGLLLAKAATVQANIARAAYGISGKSTRIGMDAAVPQSRPDWIKFNISDSPVINAVAPPPPADEFQIIRQTAVYTQSERLELAEAPIAEAICDEAATAQASVGQAETVSAAPAGWVVLDGVYTELKSGRWVIVAGERADIKDANGNPVRGMRSAELAMIAEVVHDFDATLPGDSVHTRIRLSEKLAYCYQRENVTIYANVVKATHGETRRETLGGGDGSQAFQRFALRQPPLTYVSAPTPAGAESTLKIFVNDVRWHEAESICGLGPTDRRFVTERNDEEITTAVFGDGERGARLPTGAENVRAEYRQGLGKSGNVNAEQLSQLTARPLGVREVINPLRAAGGADRESRDEARKNAPLAVLALDRLVSAQDYADFARTFAGVGKAYATRLSDGRQQLVHLTIAGADDAPIDPTSDLWRNLRQALRRFGDPALPFMLAVRERVLLLISANVRILPDYQWEKVARQLRARLLDTFSFDKRELGQDALLGEAIAALQQVAGVVYVDVDIFGATAEKNNDGTVRTPKELLDAARLIIDGSLNNGGPNQRKPQPRVAVNLPQLGGGQLRAAQLAYLAPEVPDLLILNQVVSDAS